MSVISIQTKKLSELDEINAASDDALIVVSESGITKSITKANLLAALSTLETGVSTLETNVTSISDVLEIFNADGAGPHNAICYMGNLGTEVTDDQLLAISDGTFSGIYPGCYWTLNGTKYYVGGCNYYYNCGDTNFATNHLLMFPATYLYSAQMNSSATTEGAYVGSEMYTTNLADAITTISTDFGDNLLTHRIHLKTAVTSGYVSAGSWYDSQVDLMNEVMVYGSNIYSAGNSLGTTIPNLYTAEKSQIPLFQHRHDLIGIRTTWWLRDVVSATDFATVGSNGYAHYFTATYSRGVRPAFCIG